MPWWWCYGGCWGSAGCWVSSSDCPWSTFSPAHWSRYTLLLMYHRCSSLAEVLRPAGCQIILTHSLFYSHFVSVAVFPLTLKYWNSDLSSWIKHSDFIAPKTSPVPLTWPSRLRRPGQTENLQTHQQIMAIFILANHNMFRIFLGYRNQWLMLVWFLYLKSCYQTAC